MISYDVVSLFTNVPLQETKDIAVENKKGLKKLFEFSTAKTNFLINGETYDQIDGVAMGSPLGPALANLYMGFYEKEWLKSTQGSKTRHYRRYVDDIFYMVENAENADNFLAFLTS